MENYIHYVWIEEGGNAVHYRVGEITGRVQMCSPKFGEWIDSAYENVAEIKRDARKVDSVKSKARFFKVNF